MNAMSTAIVPVTVGTLDVPTAVPTSLFIVRGAVSSFSWVGPAVVTLLEATKSTSARSTDEAMCGR